MARIRRSKTNTTYFLDIPKAVDENVERKKKWKKKVKSESDFFNHSKISRIIRESRKINEATKV